jgi:hypothetical protein
MDEARAVIHRLERIEALEHEGAAPQLLLAEVRELLREGEAWVRAERDGTELATEAIERCRLAHGRGSACDAAEKVVPALPPRPLNPTGSSPSVQAEPASDERRVPVA